MVKQTDPGHEAAKPQTKLLNSSRLTTKSTLLSNSMYTYIPCSCWIVNSLQIENATHSFVCHQKRGGL